LANLLLDFHVPSGAGLSRRLDWVCLFFISQDVGRLLPETSKTCRCTVCESICERVSPDLSRQGTPRVTNRCGLPANQAFFEDTFPIVPAGYEILNPSSPYSAKQIEPARAKRNT
jgi:hypothetical protein